MIPQIIILSLCLVGLTVNLVKHDEIKESPNYNFWEKLLNISLLLSLLYWGGFFDTLLNALNN